MFFIIVPNQNEVKHTA